MTRIASPVTLSTLALLLSAGLCIGQPVSQPAPAQPATAHPASSPATATASREHAQMPVLTDQRISLRFSGGLLADYIAALKSLPGNPPLNIVLNNGAEKAEVPPVAFTEVSPLVALQILEEIASISGGIVINSFGGEGSAGGEPVWVISARERPRRPAEFLKTSVFSLGIKTSDKPDTAASTEQDGRVTSILSAIEAALSLSSGQATQLKFHRESGLLFVRGTDDDEHVVRDVIKELNKPEREQVLSEIDAKLRTILLEQAKLEREDKAMTEELADARKMVRDIDNQNRADVDRNERDAHLVRIESLSARQDAIRERLMQLQQQHAELIKKSNGDR